MSLGARSDATASRSRRRRVDLDDIVSTARAILDEGGPEALSMRSLADRLGITPMALYRYVPDRAGLEAEVVRSALADLVLPDSASLGWEAAVAAWMRSVRTHWLRHPWFGSMLAIRAESNRGWRDLLEPLALPLRAAGLSEAFVARLLVLVPRLTIGVVVLELTSPVRASVAADDTDEWQALRAAAGTYDDDALFDDLVAITIAGLRERLAADDPSRPIKETS